MTNLADLPEADRLELDSPLPQRRGSGDAAQRLPPDGEPLPVRHHLQSLQARSQSDPGRHAGIIASATRIAHVFAR